MKIIKNPKINKPNTPKTSIETKTSKIYPGSQRVKHQRQPEFHFLAAQYLYSPEFTLLCSILLALFIFYTGLLKNSKKKVGEKKKIVLLKIPISH